MKKYEMPEVEVKYFEAEAVMFEEETSRDTD